jgi:hypothetical protein
MLGWWSDKQAQVVAVNAKSRSGSMWSWFGRSMKEALVAREMIQFLRCENQGDVPKVGDVVDFYERVCDYAGLRPNKNVKKGSPYTYAHESRTFRTGE